MDGEKCQETGNTQGSIENESYFNVILIEKLENEHFSTFGEVYLINGRNSWRVMNYEAKIPREEGSYQDN